MLSSNDVFFLQPEKSIWRTYMFWTCNSVYEFNLESQAQSAPNNCVRTWTRTRTFNSILGSCAWNNAQLIRIKWCCVFFESHMPKNSRWWCAQLSCSWLLMREWHACEANIQMRQHGPLSCKLLQYGQANTLTFNVNVFVYWIMGCILMKIILLHWWSYNILESPILRMIDFFS